MEASLLSCVKNNGKKRNTPTKSAPDTLSDYSPSDQVWNTHRAVTDDVGGIYSGVVEFERYAARMESCSGLLRFGWDSSPDTGESRLKLREASFCRVRHCPVCQWRRSLMWQARFYQSLPRLVAEHPKARWVFLTLTVRNCAVSDLGKTLSAMNEAWHRFVKRREFAPVLGWVRTTEVTLGKNRTAHPHFHALLMVPPSWFTTKYVRQSRWVELWGDCLRVDYAPSVDVRVVKPKKLVGDETPTDVTASALQSAVAETLKYSTKPSDMTADHEWFLELTRQTHRRRFIATGGALRDVLKVDDETDQDLVIPGDTPADADEVRLAFGWRPSERVYRRSPSADK